MNRILLRYDSFHQVTGASDLWVIVLTDMARKKAISVVCDEDMSVQLKMRIYNPDISKILLPEALLQLLSSTYEMLIVGIYDGQYQVMLMDMGNGESVRLRMSDAVLLSIISKTPLFIEEGLMQKQCYPCEDYSNGVAIPINSMNMEHLKHALKKAVEDENYELASHLRDEINLRNTHTE